MNTPGPSGKTDFTGIVNSVQTLTQIVGQGGKPFVPVLAASVSRAPVPSPGNALDMIRVNAAGANYETRTPAQIIADFGLINTVPVGASNSTTGTTISVTTTSFTAPCSGALVIIGRGGSPSPAGSSSLATSLAGAVVVFQVAAAVSRAFGYLPMNASQSTTATFQLSTLTSQALVATVAAFFLPQA